MKMKEAEVRERLMGEFRSVFSNAPEAFMEIRHGLGHIVFLSGPHDTSRPECLDAYEMSAQNVARAMYSALLYATFGVTGTCLVLSGETEQLPSMSELVIGYGIPYRSIAEVNSGDRGKSNTKTQFETLRTHFNTVYLQTALGPKIVVVTNQYHVPRVLRYAKKFLPGFVEWQVVGVPHDTGLYDWDAMVKGEIDRIIRYAGQGDIPLFLD
jgi:hypothetical protein